MPRISRLFSISRRLYGVLLLAVWLGILAAEVLGLRFPLAGKDGTVLWFISYLFFFVFAAGSVVQMARNVRAGNVLLPLMVALWAVMVAINIPVVRNVSFESTQQIAQTLDLLRYSQDWGFRESCFLGYPARQFFLPAVPTILLGRSVVALNLGGSLYFFLGLLIFSSGVLASFNNKRAGDLVGAIFLALLLHVHYVNYQLFWFEQSIYPFAFAMIFTGLVLHYLKEPSRRLLVLMAFCLLYLAASYTPSLAVFGLGIVTLAYLAVWRTRSWADRVLVALLIAGALVSLYLSIPNRRDVALANRITISGREDIETKAVEAAKYVLFQTRTPGVVSPVIYSGFLFGIVAPLSFLYGWEMAFLSLWILGALWMSMMTKGYAAPPLEFAVHRANTVFPVLLAMMIRMLRPISFAGRRGFWLGLVLWLFLLGTGLYYQSRVLDRKWYEERVRHMALIQWFQTQVDPGPWKGKLYFDPTIRSQFLVIHDMLQYFLPGWRNAVLERGIGDLTVHQAGYRRFLIIPRGRLASDPMYGTIRNGLVHRGEFRFKPGEVLDIYQCPD